MAKKFRAALDLFHSICVTALRHIAQVSCWNAPCHSNADSGKGGNSGERVITEKMLDTTMPFIEMGSSVSVVRYHALTGEPGKVCDGERWLNRFFKMAVL